MAELTQAMIDNLTPEEVLRYVPMPPVVGRYFEEVQQDLFSAQSEEQEARDRADEAESGLRSLESSYEDLQGELSEAEKDRDRAQSDFLVIETELEEAKNTITVLQNTIDDMIKGGDQ